MSSPIKIQTIIIPEGFQDILNDAMSYVSKDELFIEAINNKVTKFNKIDKRYQNNKQNKMFSIKIRFIIAEYVRKQKIKELSRLKNDNAKINNS